MKIFIVFVVSFCASIPKINADIESDIDLELYKHLDVSPYHTPFDHDVDFDDESHITFDSNYDGGGSDIHEDNDEINENNNYQNNDKNKKTSDENDPTIHNAKKNSADYDNDDEDGEVNEGTENDDAGDDDDDDDGDDENDDDGDNEDSDDEEATDESKTESTTIKNVDPNGTETVDPRSSQYISPHDVSHRLSREKRSKKTDKPNQENDYDFARSYRDFVREHFGMDEAKTLSDENKKKKTIKQQSNEDDDNGEAEEDEDYEEGAEDGETEDDISDNKGAPASAPAPDQYYDDDPDEENDNNEDNNSKSKSSDEDEDYLNVKKLSQETDENPEFCKTVYKDDQECQVCKNPKTHDKSETCSYSSSPTPKRYAYKKEKNYHSNDDDSDSDDESDEVKPKKNTPKKKKAKKHDRNSNSGFDDDDFPSSSTKKKTPKSKQKSKKHSKKNKSSKSNNGNQSPTGSFQPSYPYYHGYQDRRTSTPLRNHYFGDNKDDLSFRASESFPVTASSESYDKDIDIFKGRDWSQCTRKINKEGLTCYYCKDLHGATQEECMYIAGNDEDNPLKPKVNKTTKRNSDNKSKKNKKNKKNNANSRKSTITTTTTTTTTTPKTINSSPRLYDTRTVNQNSQEQYKDYGNFNISPKGISSISWETNHSQPSPRTLNRNQNFNSAPIPILRQNMNSNPLRISVPYEISELESSNNNVPMFGTTIKPSESPVKTLEYTEPRNRETLKRMIKQKISTEEDSDKQSKSPTADHDATVFYSKVLRKF